MRRKPTPAEPKLPVRVALFSYNASKVLDGESTGFGGTELQMVRLSQLLQAERGLEVILLTISRRQSPGTFESVRVARIPPPPDLQPSHSWIWRRAVVLLYLIRFAKVAWRVPTDVYLTSLGSIESIALRIVAFTRRKPYIFRIASEWETNQRDLMAHVLSGSKILGRCFRWSLRSAAAVVVQTDQQRNALVKNFGVRGVLIPNAHEIPALPGGKREGVLWVGRCHPLKQPQLLLGLAESLPDAEFTMICPPTSSHQALFQEVSTRATAIENLKFIHGVDSAQISQYYSRAKVLVITSSSEGFSNVMIEALKHGVPVVSLTVNPDAILASPGQSLKVRTTGVYHHVLAGRKIGFCCDGNMELLRTLVCELMADHMVWKQLSTDAYEFAAETFSTKVVGSKYKELVCDVVQGKCEDSNVAHA